MDEQSSTEERVKCVDKRLGCAQDKPVNFVVGWKSESYLFPLRSKETLKQRP